MRAALAKRKRPAQDGLPLLPPGRLAPARRLPGMIVAPGSWVAAWARER